MNHHCLLHSLLLIGLSSSVVCAELDLSLPRSAAAVADPTIASRPTPDSTSPAAKRFDSVDPARDVLHTLSAVPIADSARHDMADRAAGFRKSSMVPALLVLGIMVVLRVKLKHYWEQQRVPAV